MYVAGRVAVTYQIASKLVPVRFVVRVVNVVFRARHSALIPNYCRKGLLRVGAG